jgi:ATP adenylyltransferase
VSLTCPEEVIVPYDCEGKYLLQEIPVIAGEPGSAELAARAARALREHKGAIIKGHGVLATGQSVKEAYTVLSSIEHSCQVKYYVELGQRKVKPREEIWAPWRIGYILEEKPQGCFLCEKPAEQRDTENYILHRGEKNFLLLNTYPYNPGHLMVAPYRHVGDLEKLTPEERREHFEMVIQGVTLLKKVLSPQGFNLGLNLGRTAGAGVEAHLHTHIVPRWEGDTNYMPVLADTKVIPEALAATYHKLKHSFNPPL